MTELIKQLVEEIKDVEIAPKCVVIKENLKSFNRNDLNRVITGGKIIFCGDDKEKLKNRLLEQIYQEFSLEKYLKIEQLNDYSLIIFDPRTESIFTYKRGIQSEPYIFDSIVGIENIESSVMSSIEVFENIVVLITTSEIIKYMIIGG